MLETNEVWCFYNIKNGNGYNQLQFYIQNAKYEAEKSWDSGVTTIAEVVLTGWSESSA